MTHFDYQVSREILLDDPPFYRLIMAAMRKADTRNAAILKSVFPAVWGELMDRYHAPGGLLPGEGGAS